MRYSAEAPGTGAPDRVAGAGRPWAPHGFGESNCGMEAAGVGAVGRGTSHDRCRKQDLGLDGGSMIQEERVKNLNGGRVRNGDFVLYWMQASQREEYNHALEYAIGRGNELNRPVVVFFGLTERFPEANERHYRFMLEGLTGVRTALERRGILMVTRHGPPDEGAAALSRRACLAVVDRGYLRVQRRWRRRAARLMSCPLVQVESDVVVPVEAASPKEEFSAATIRPKIMGKLGRFLVPLKRVTPRRDSLGLAVRSLDLEDADGLIGSIGVDGSVGPAPGFLGGTAEAKKRLDGFIRKKLRYFNDLRNDPTRDCLSGMSPYLHFGQISPLYIALRVRAAGGPSAEAYLEELVVRRELSMNFVHYNRRYDSFEGLPEWCRKTLEEHTRDGREYVYSRRQLENGRTHDPYWNAAQEEMRFTGKMHGYMRMYWGKKILEWLGDPKRAYRTALYLNNKYELDGRDPNGFSGVAWCFGKHDRPWGERRVFGKVRYMNDRGLRRKFDADGYVEKIRRSIEGL